MGSLFQGGLQFGLQSRMSLTFGSSCLCLLSLCTGITSVYVLLGITLGALYMLGKHCISSAIAPALNLNTWSKYQCITRGCAFPLLGIDWCTWAQFSKCCFQLHSPSSPGWQRVGRLGSAPLGMPLICEAVLPHLGSRDQLSWHILALSYVIVKTIRT